MEDLSRYIKDYGQITQLCGFIKAVISSNIRNVHFDDLGRALSYDEVVFLIGATCHRAANRNIIIKVRKVGVDSVPYISKVFVTRHGTREMIKILEDFCVDGEYLTKDIAIILKNIIGLS